MLKTTGGEEVTEKEAAEKLHEIAERSSKDNDLNLHRMAKLMNIPNTNTPIIEQEELEKSYQRQKKFVVIDYQTEQTRFFSDKNDLIDFIQNLSHEFGDEENLNDCGIEVYDVDTENLINIRVEKNVQVTID